MPQTMSEADAEPEPGWGALRKRSDELITRYAGTMKAIDAGAYGPDWSRQVNLLTAEHRRHCADLARITFSAAYVSEAEDRAYERGRADERAVRVPGQRKHRHAAQRGFAPRLVQGLPGIALPAGLAAAFGRRLAAHHAITSLAGAGAATAGLVAVTVALGPSHTLQEVTPWSQPPPASPTAKSYAPHLPADRLISITDPDNPKAYRKPVRPLVITYAPAPRPVLDPAPVVTVTPSQPAPDPAPSTDSSPSSDPSQSSDWQAQGKHASQWSGEGDSGYHGRHDGGSQDWPQGAGQDAGQQQDAGGQDAGSTPPADTPAPPADTSTPAPAPADPAAVPAAPAPAQPPAPVPASS